MAILNLFGQIDIDVFEGIFLSLSINDQLNLRLTGRSVNQRCMVAWGRVRTLTLNYGNRDRSTIRMVDYIINLKGRPHDFLYQVLNFMTNLTSLVIDYDCNFVRLSGSDREYSSKLLLKVLKCCPKICQLTCFGVPITERVVKQLLVKKRLRKFCFDTVGEGCVCLVRRLLESCVCLVEVSIPRFSVVSGNYLPDISRVWEFPKVSGCFKCLNVGGTVQVDLGILLNSPLVSYANRSRDGTMLNFVDRQLSNLLNFRQLTILHLPYSDLNDTSFIRIVDSLKNLENLDITGCFNLSAVGYRKLRFIKGLKFLSIGFLPLSYSDLECIDSLEFLGLSRCMLYKIEFLRLILRLLNLKRVVVFGTISYRVINDKVDSYFENELSKFVQEFPILRREIVIYYDDFLYDYWEKLDLVEGIYLSRICGFVGGPNWYVQEISYSYWLTLNREVVDIVKGLHW